jgi:hypothetical protein
MTVSDLDWKTFEQYCCKVAEEIGEAKKTFQEIGRTPNYQFEVRIIHKPEKIRAPFFTFL